VKTQTKTGAALIFVCCLTLTACSGGGPDSAAVDVASQSEAQRLALIGAAVADSRRSPDDIARDVNRKPEEVLQFIGIRPGMAVLDMFAGGGYYTELFQYVVGPEGKVVAYNNTGYSMIAAKQTAARFADGRLANVQQMVSENNALELPATVFDRVFFGLSYHDIYYLDGERGWEKIDRAKMLAEVFAALKPGGVVVVVDHVALSDMPAEEVRPLHRISPDSITKDFLAAGFNADGESDVLRNTDDNHAVIAMAPQVRGKTDRAVLRFRKPE
jgi:predicted methyltransferase